MISKIKKRWPQSPLTLPEDCPEFPPDDPALISMVELVYEVVIVMGHYV